MERRWASRACVESKRRSLRYERGAAGARAARLAATIEGGILSFALRDAPLARNFYYFFAVLVCCANQDAPTSALGIGFCVI